MYPHIPTESTHSIISIEAEYSHEQLSPYGISENSLHSSTQQPQYLKSLNSENILVSAPHLSLPLMPCT